MWATTPRPENHLKKPPNNWKKCKKVDKRLQKKEADIPLNFCIIYFGNSLWLDKKMLDYRENILTVVS